MTLLETLNVLCGRSGTLGDLCVLEGATKLLHGLTFGVGFELKGCHVRLGEDCSGDARAVTELHSFRVRELDRRLLDGLEDFRSGSWKDESNSQAKSQPTLFPLWT